MEAVGEVVEVEAERAVATIPVAVTASRATNPHPGVVVAATTLATAEAAADVAAAATASCATNPHPGVVVAATTLATAEATANVAAAAAAAGVGDSAWLDYTWFVCFLRGHPPPKPPSVVGF